MPTDPLGTAVLMATCTILGFWTGWFYRSLTISVWDVLGPIANRQERTRR